MCIIVLACTTYTKRQKGWDISSSLSRSALKSYSFYLKRHLDLQIKFSSMLLQLRLHLENSAAVQNAIFPRIPLFILIQVYFGSFCILLLLKTSIAIEFMHDRFMVVYRLDKQESWRHKSRVCLSAEISLAHLNPLQFCFGTAPVRFKKELEGGIHFVVYILVVRIETQFFKVFIRWYR